MKTELPPIEDEITLISTKPTMRRHPFLFLLCLALILFHGLGLVLLLIWFIRCYFVRYIFTTKRTLLKKLFVSHEILEIRHCDLRTISTNQGPFIHYFDIGDLILSSAAWDSKIKIKNTPRFQEINELLHRLQKEEN